MRSTRYDLYGAAAGVGLPVLGTVIEAWSRGGLSPERLVAAFAGQPLLWIMATTPVVLGGLGHVLVRQHGEIMRQSGEIVRQSGEIVALEQARRESLQGTASELFGSARGLLGNVSAFTRTNEEAAGSVREASATLHALAQASGTAALTAEKVIGIALKAERAGEKGRLGADGMGRDLLELADEVRGLSARIEALDARLTEVVAAAGIDGPGSRLPARLAEALSAAQRTMGGAVELARAGVVRAGAVAQKAGETAQVVQDLAAALTAVAQAAREIARVAQQQERGVDDARRAIAGIDHATEGAMASTQEVAKEARALNELATALREAVKSAPAPRT